MDLDAVPEYVADRVRLARDVTVLRAALAGVALPKVRVAPQASPR